MKKEVISYSGFSMMPPESLELLENNKGRVFIDEIEQIVDIPDYKILSFWDRIEQIGIWKWKKSYNPKYEILDGYQWELKLRNRKGEAKYIEGHESYPKKFKDLIKELNILFGSKIKF